MNDRGIAPDTAPPEPGRQILLPKWVWAGFAVFIGLVLFLAGVPTPVAQALAAVSIGIAMVHAACAFGWRAALVFLVICLVVTFATENLSVATGLPFGRYHFVVGAGLPHVGAIPVIVGFLYFGLGYPSWVIAGILLDHAGLQPDNRFRLLALPVIASFVLVQWDVVMDPPSSTLGGAWIWHDGGGYFGVPLSNYFGWYLTVWIFFQGFAWWQFSRPSRPARPVHRESLFWLIPIILYLAAGLCQIVPLLMTGNEVVVDAAGQHWRARDLRETTVIVMTATMLATSILALLRWLDGLRR